MALFLKKPALLELDGNALSDHNREPVEQEDQLFNNDVRTVNATLRRQHIGTKKRFSVSWSMLPAKSEDTVDGFWGADDMKSFYASNSGASFTFTIYDEDDPVGTEYTVMFTNFSSELIHRWDQYLWDVNFEVEEV